MQFIVGGSGIFRCRGSEYKLSEGCASHGGGDKGLVDALYDALIGEASDKTSLEKSAESHLIAIAAERSRMLGGALVSVH